MQQTALFVIIISIFDKITTLPNKSWLTVF